MVSFVGGANSSIDPSLIKPNQFAWGQNMIVRGGFPRSRPGFKFIKALVTLKINPARSSFL